MKNKDKLTLIIFSLLIVIILGLFAFNLHKNKKIKNENTDRKVEYIFEGFTYDNVYNKGSELFTQVIELLNNNDIFDYEKDLNNKIKYYAINNYTNYKKIKNFRIVTNTLSSLEIAKYMELRKIIKHENNYYIENTKEEIINNNYIGSVIDIKTYDNKYVYFSSINYYCENYKYIGILDKNPNCNFTTKETNFTIVLENNSLRINNLEEIKNILK